MGMIIDPYRFAVPALSVSWVSSGAITSGANPSWASQAIGTASSTRYVVVMVYSNAGSRQTVSSVTIGGVSATLLFTNNSDYGASARTTTHFYGLLVTSGTTATIQVNWSGAPDQTGISVYSVTGSTTPSVSQTAASNGTATPSASLSIPVNGVGIGAAAGGNGGTVTWTNLTEDLDLNAATFYTFSTASSSSAGTATRSAAPTAGSVANAFALIALQP